MSMKSGFLFSLNESLNYIVLLGREFKEHQYYTVLISHDIDCIAHLWSRFLTKKVILKCDLPHETDFGHWNSAWDLLENCWQIFSSGTLLDFLILMVNFVALQVNMIIKQECKQTNIFPRRYWTPFEEIRTEQNCDWALTVVLANWQILSD